MRSRITLLKSFQTAAEYGSLPFKSVRFETIFNNRPLLPRIQLAANPPRTLSQGSPDVTDQFVISPTRSYAAATNSGGGKRSQSPTVVSPSGSPKSIMVNEQGQRVDKPIPNAPTSAYDSLQPKIREGKRFCNSFHLTGQCSTPPGQHCNWLHGQLTEGEVLVLRKQLRRQACHSGVECREGSCFYGHNCVCNSNSCKFSKDMHHVDTRVVQEISCG